jgi:osmotically-inducible protein OsmY
MKIFLTVLMAILLLGSGPSGTALAGPQKKPQLDSSRRDHGYTTARIADEVRHQLVTLPYYDVFDWLEGQVLPDDTVVLRGQVTQPTLKSDAEARARKLESVANVRNEIEVLPLSSSDDDIRVATYRAIFNYNGPLFRYATRAASPIHIIVKNGHVTLKGVVANSMDSQLAYMAARGVPGVFDVTNELMVEKTS